jgi:hypothetical protein
VSGTEPRTLAYISQNNNMVPDDEREKDIDESGRNETGTKRLSD